MPLNQNQMLSGPILQLLNNLGDTGGQAEGNYGIEQLLSMMQPVAPDPTSSDLARQSLVANMEGEMAGLESLLPGISSVTPRPADSAIQNVGAFQPQDPRLAAIPDWLYPGYGSARPEVGQLGGEHLFFKPSSLGGLGTGDDAGASGQDASGLAGGIVAQALAQGRDVRGDPREFEGRDTDFGVPEWEGDFSSWLQNIAGFVTNPVAGLIRKVYDLETMSPQEQMMANPQIAAASQLASDMEDRDRAERDLAAQIDAATERSERQEREGRDGGRDGDFGGGMGGGGQIGEDTAGPGW